MYASAWYTDNYFGLCRPAKAPEDLKGTDALVLWGGEDISPSMYGQKVGRAYASIHMSPRDRAEWELAKEAVRLGIPIIGICRGAQLLCALDGGTLWQHVNNHTGLQHPIIVKDTIIGYTNSAHHQMMRPKEGNEILAVTHGALSKYKFAEDNVPIESEEDEPEIVYFPRLKAIGVQGHPEWLKPTDFLPRITKELVKEKLNVDIL